MSKYLEDIQGKIVSNPINETNTKYPYIDSVDGVRHGDEYLIDSQYMYNHNEPVSDIDTAYYDDYRNKVEELRKRTESTYEALESCLVPVEVPGMSFQPYELLNTETPDGDVIEEKVKSFTYFFQDHLSPIGVKSKEFVFRTNKVKFIDDRHRRLIYDRTIHIMSLKEDEDNKVPFKNVILRTFFEYYNDKYFSLVRNTNATILSYNTIAKAIFDLIKSNREKCILIDENGNEKELESVSDFDTCVMQSGQDIDTTIPSTLYNLYNIGWTNAAMVFLNGLAIEWNKIILSVDNIDTFIIVSNLTLSASSLIDDDKEIFLDYVHIPFKVAYLIGGISDSSLENRYVSDGKINKQIIFTIYKDYASIVFDSLITNRDFQQANISYNYDRIICLDPNIKYAEFALDNGDNNNLKNAGINYTKSFKEFCDNDYRCKLKQFNFLGFELDRYFETDSLKRGTFKNDDFTITWHPFNIMDIRFKRLYNRKRIFKVFYNTKVLYDQDNILRIKNHGKLADEYEKYRQDVTANIETYINEIYILAKKDIGTYLATNGIMYDYKFHYVSPYECFLLYNAINMVMGSSYISFDDFRKINVVGTKNNNTTFRYEINPKLVVNSKGICRWIINNIDTSLIIITVYESKTNQKISPDIEIVDDNTIAININSDTNILENTYKAVIQVNDSIDKHSYLNYLNGGFIAVPKNKDSMFSGKIKEEDIFDKNKNLTSTIRDYISSITKNTAVTLLDILIPIDNEKRDDNKVASDAFYMYKGDTRGKVIPFLPIMNKFGLIQEYSDLRYDTFKLRFELSYLNNMEEGATPIDEFIYYLDNTGLKNLDTYPVVSNDNLTNRKTALVLDALAENIFKYDPNLVLDSIKKLNWSADYIIPKDFGGNKKENYITTCDNQYYSSDYRLDPRFYYNYGYYDKDNIPHKLVSEWGLRRNLPEMFISSIDKHEYTIDSMHLLDEVFDFTYNLDKSYEENLKHGLNYIIGYDADKLEQSIKRSIVSITKTGEEILNILSNNHYEKTCTLDGYKLITFIKNENQKIVFDNIKIIVTVSSLGNSVIPSSIQYINEEGKTVNFTYAEMRHKSQDHTTIVKNVTSFKDVDKNFEQTFTSMKYNRTTEMLEYYNNGELVITLQVDKVIDLSRVVMSRWNISNQDNYVMIFKNRELYSKYHTIEYTDITFSFEKEQNIYKTDKFEFVFFLNANNRIMKKICETDDDLKLSIPNAYYSKSSNSIRTDMNGNPMDKGLYENMTETVTLDKAISCNTSIIDAENVQLLVNIMPKDDNDKWDITNTENTTYELSYNMKSYRAITSEYNDNKHFIHSLENDKKINGLHRVTKQGGGEYFLEFNGKVPENPGTGRTIVKPGDGGSGITGIGLMALATKNVVSIKYNGTEEQWNSISKTLPWIRDANNLNNSGGITCTDGNIKVPLEETLVGRSE